MLNNLILVGRLTSDPEIKEVNEKKVCNITLAVQRTFKNMEGIYETDFIDIVLWQGIADNVSEYCKKGDVLGVKGRLQTRTYLKEDGTKEKKLEVIADKITFLSSKKVGEENGNN